MLTILDYAGVAVFAATGALAASRQQLDPIGFLFFAAMTGIGGGTIRDLVLGQRPVFWVENPAYLLVCAGVAGLVFFTAHLFESRYRLLLWLDAIGLAAYCVMGAAKGYAASGSAVVAIVAGAMTATFGGILRDVLSEEPSVLMRPEIYVTAAMLGAAVFMLAITLAAPLWLAALAGAASAFALRGGALFYGWRIPSYRPRPGRAQEESLKKDK
ncbi:MAG: trimeric intracellular cation channel family protein [Proteobacteria bacterium]|nr:trimeric intracellular cation channel family protein [Pseudomonadota bacterium]